MFKSLTLLALLPLVVQARIGGRDLSGSGDGGSGDDTCDPVPLRIRGNGEGVLFDSMYVGAFYDNGTNPIMDEFELCDAYMDAYNNNTKCEHLAGSFREIGACQVLSEAVGPENSKLLKLEYFSNSVNGSVLYAPEETNGECSCLCGQGQEAIVGIEYQGTCVCFCEPQDYDCDCIPPTEDTVVDYTNKYYSASVQGTTIKFTDLPQLELLDIFECDTNTTIYNETSVCPGMESQAFSDLLTDFPSASPTEAPSEFP